MKSGVHAGLSSRRSRVQIPSLPPHPVFTIGCNGQVAQLVERWSEKPEVGGSIPPLTTKETPGRRQFLNCWVSNQSPLFTFQVPSRCPCANTGRVAPERSWRPLTARYEKRCPKCSLVTSERRCPTDGANATWGFVLEAGKEGGKRRRIARRGFETKRQAQAAAKGIEKDLDATGPIKPSALTVQEWLDHWMQIRQSEGIKASTLDSYRAIIDSRVKPRIGLIRLRDLTSLDLKKLYSNLLTRGLSTGSVKNTHTMLHKALLDAVKERLIPRNYAEGAFKTRVKRREMKGWGATDLRAFLNAALGHRMYALMRLSAMTGMRRAEVVGLRWSDVDLEGDTVHVRKTLTKANHGSELENPKSHRGIRAIDLDPDTVLVLRTWRQAQSEEALAFGRVSFQQNNAHGLVFTRPDGVPLHPDVVSKMFRGISERANLPRIRFHDLRRTHGSLLLQQGTPLHVVSRRLGHASAAFTADVYADVLPGQAGDAVSKLAESLGPQAKHSIT